MVAEYNSLKEHNIFLPVMLPESENVVGCRWVYKLKTLPDNTQQYKARLVAQRFTQRSFEHYNQVFAPTAKIETFRLVLVLAAS